MRRSPRELARHGIASLLFDYRGYGGNPGTPSEKGLASDARAALRYVASRRDVDGDRIVYFGESLGSGVAVGLALEQPPFALILRSPFTSLVDVGRVHYPFLPVALVLRDRFPSLARIASLQRPLLVIATDRDEVVPIAQSERLYNAATSPKRLVIIEGAGHNDEEILAGRRVIAAIVEFLNGAIRETTSIAESAETRREDGWGGDGGGEARRPLRLAHPEGGQRVPHSDELLPRRGTHFADDLSTWSQLCVLTR